jgi:magnesium transporter
MDASGYRQTSDLGEVPALIARTDVCIWIDADGASEALTQMLQSALNLHPLVVEDIYSDRLTPKVEEFDGYLYVVMHGVQRDGADPDALCTIELDVVIGRSWVFTHHSMPMQTVDDLRNELSRNPRLLGRGAAFVAHALIDKLTDYYLPVVDRFDDEIEELEKEVVERPSTAVVPRIFALRRSIQRLRRVSVHQREVLQRMSRGEFESIPTAALPFYRDVYDHFVRIADLADSYREFVTAALETYMSVTANRTNEIMKVLAIISTIMLPLTFIAGLYGMNFEHMPELRWKWGYPFAIGLMLTVTCVLVWWFRRRGWFDFGEARRHDAQGTDAKRTDGKREH